MAYLSAQQISCMGFAGIGHDVNLSDKATFYNPAQITIGNHVRIDDFCILSAGIGGIEVQNNIHIAPYSSLVGAGKITLCDFANISSRVAIFSSSDDYSGQFLTGPTVPPAYTRVTHAPVVIGRHVVLGCGTVVLPGVTINDCSAIGALSLVNADCDPFYIYAGVPAKKLKPRHRQILNLEKLYLESIP